LEGVVSLVAGDKFPVDIAVAGRRRRITVSELVAAGPVVVAFHRLWCPFCQQAARDLAGVKAQLDAAGARVVLVYRDDVDTVGDSCAQRGIPFDCVSDSGRELENAADIERFSIARYAAFSPSKLVRALRSGSRAGRPDSGVLQGRGTFVIDGDGRIVYAHHSTTAADIPPIADVLAAVQSVARRPDQRKTT
jgi:peroxiredoxin